MNTTEISEARRNATEVSKDPMNTAEVSKDPMDTAEIPKYNMRNGILSLTHLARLKCINNAHAINDIGTTPYHLIEPVLMKKTAKSLREMERRSPQIIKDSEMLWKSLLKRDFPDRPINQIAVQKGSKVNMSSRSLYDRYVKEREVQRENAVGNLKQITKNLNNLKNKHKVKAINRVLPTNKPKLSYHRSSTTSASANFKSSLLQKARVANKQRIRHFMQPKTGVNRQVNHPAASNEWVRLGKGLNGSHQTAVSTRPELSKRAGVSMTQNNNIRNPSRPIISSNASSDTPGKRKLGTSYSSTREKLKRPKNFVHKV